ncbi:MAG: hypothetical protein WBN90_10570, partial [Gammaproteobacteria bacterium]
YHAARARKPAYNKTSACKAPTSQRSKEKHRACKAHQQFGEAKKSISPGVTSKARIKNNRACKALQQQE